MAVAVAVIAGLVLATAVRLWGVNVMRMTSGSMSPAANVGDWVVVSKRKGHVLFWAARDDIVLFTFPIGSTELAIKRVIGLPGDRIEVHERIIAVNGRIIAISGAPNDATAVSRTEVVPAGALFLLGDNAANSIDSRSFGSIREREVHGQVLFSLRPWMVWFGFGLTTAIVIAVGLLGGRGPTRDRKHHAPAASHWLTSPRTLGP